MNFNVLRRSSYRFSKMYSHLASAAPSPSLSWKEIRIPVPWGHIAAKEWGNPGGRPVLGLHGWQDNSGTFDTLIPLLSSDLHVVAVDLPGHGLSSHKPGAKEWGSGGSHRILGVHGWLDNCCSFDPVARFLPSDIHFVAVDLPGHGLSSHKPLGIFYNAFDYLLDVHRIVDHLGWNDFSFICHSLGVPIGLAYAGCYPERVKKFISLDGSRFVCSSPDQLAKETREKISQMLEFEKTMNNSHRPLKFQRAVNLLIKATHGSANEETAKILLTRGSQVVNDDEIIFCRDPRVRIGSLLQVAHSQSVSLANDIAFEFLLIESTRGILRIVVPSEEVDDFLRALKMKAKRFEHVIVDGTHHVHMNNPEKVAPYIVRFLCTN